MNCKLLFVSVALGLCPFAKADFTQDFQEALKLYNENKGSEAAGKFEELAKVAPTADSKSDSFFYAAMSQIKAKNFDDAKELIGKIPNESQKKICQMNLLMAQNKFQDLINSFKDEDFTKFAEPVIFDAFRARAAAYAQANNFEAAIKDLQEAEKFTTNANKKLGLYNDMAYYYISTKKIDDALAYFKKIEDFKQFKGYGIYNGAIIEIANILKVQEKYGEALEELKKIPDTKEAYWKTRPIVVEAEIYAAQGKKDEAIAKYNEALKYAADNMKQNIQSAIDKLK